MITVTAHPAVAAALRDAQPAWLEPAARSRSAYPPACMRAASRSSSPASRSAWCVLLFDELEAIDPDVERLLTAVSAAVGFALLRDRLADELRDAAGQA